MIELILSGLFLVVFVDKDYDNLYNVLLEQKSPRSGILVALRTENLEYTEGGYIELALKAECNKAYQLEEGNGKIGSPWQAADDWIWTDTNYVCNATKVYK